MFRWLHNFFKGEPHGWVLGRYASLPKIDMKSLQVTATLLDEQRKMASAKDYDSRKAVRTMQGYLKVRQAIDADPSATVKLSTVEYTKDLGERLVREGFKVTPYEFQYSQRAPYWKVSVPRLPPRDPDIDDLDWNAK